MELVLIIAITLVYCGSLAGAAWLGYRANLIVRAKRRTDAVCRFVNRLPVQIAAMALSFTSCMLFAMADKPLVAGLLVIPFSFVMSTLIYLEDPPNSCFSCGSPLR